MRCSSCGFDNREGVRFCEECGGKLEQICPACGTAVPPGRKFCGGCGQALATSDTRAAATPPPEAATSRFSAPVSYTPRHLAERILTSKAALEGERKQVTVLFADLKGSMELLADRDPEEARKLLDPVLERMMEAVHRYEGTVNQVMGDGIMALFGAPLAHEDHAVRACYAALRMQESVAQYAEGVSARTGCRSRSAWASTPARWSSAPSARTCTWTTRRSARRRTWPPAWSRWRRPARSCSPPRPCQLAEGYVQVAARGPVAVKGLAEPVEVYELTGASAQRTRLHAAAARGLTRFVGRDAEIEQLRRALALAHEGHGQVVAVVGEPGVGKSRLVYEFTHSHRTQDWLDPGSRLRVLRQGDQLPAGHRPAQDLLQDRRSRDPREIREKVTGKLLDAGSQPRADPARLPGAPRRAGRGRRTGRRSIPPSAASAPWRRSSAFCCGRARGSPCSWSSRTCTGSMPRRRPCSTAWSRVCRRPGSFCWSTIDPSTSTAG